MRNKAILVALLYSAAILGIVFISLTYASNPSTRNRVSLLATGPGLALIIGGSSVVFGVPLILFIWFLFRTPAWEQEVRANGQLASALVKDLRPLGIHVGSVFYYGATIEVQPPDETPFEARIEKPFQQLMFAQPGQMITVKYDPNNKKHIVLAQQANIPPYMSNVDPSTRPPTQVDLTGQLAQLVEMHNRGELTDTEFAAAKKKLLS